MIIFFITELVKYIACIYVIKLLKYVESHQMYINLPKYPGCLIIEYGPYVVNLWLFRIDIKNLNKFPKYILDENHKFTNKWNY